MRNKKGRKHVNLPVHFYNQKNGQKHCHME